IKPVTTTAADIMSSQTTAIFRQWRNGARRRSSKRIAGGLSEGARAAVKVDADFPLALFYRLNYPSTRIWAQVNHFFGSPLWMAAFPDPTTNEARAFDVPPGFITSETTTKSLVQLLGVTVQRT